MKGWSLKGTDFSAFSLKFCTVMDGIGVYGNFLHYAIVISLVGSAFLVFIYLWKKKRLDLDEEPKYQMMQEETLHKEEKMLHEEKDKVEDPHDGAQIEFYGDPDIATFDAKVPKFLIFNYIFWPIWGIMTFYYFWNGSLGWLDRGYWHELQIAANTTFPIENQNMLPQNPPIEENTNHSPLP